MVKKLFVPLEGLPNQGSRKKFNAKHWLTTRNNFLRGILSVSCHKQLRESE